MKKENVSKAMNTLTHGVYVLGVHANNKDNLMTAAWLCQVASSPAMLVVAVSTGHLTADMMKEAGYFTVSVLRDTQKDTAIACGRVSGRKEDKTKLVETEYTEDGIPMIKDAAAQLVCKVVDQKVVTNHTLFIAEAVSATKNADEVLLYHQKDFF